MATMATAAGRPAIAAVSEVRPGRYDEHDDVSMYDLVLADFIATHDIDPGVVDGLLVCPAGMASGDGADVFVHERMTDALGLRPRLSATLNVGGATYAAMVARAVQAIDDGLADAVLCAGAGRFPKVAGAGGDAMARMTSDPDFEYPYGTFIPAMYALVATRFMHERDAPREALAAVAVAQREWALQHPDALMADAGPLTIDDVLDSRPIAEPFNLLDCSVPCEGGGVLLVTRAELAAEITDRPAHVLGFGEHHDHGSIGHASDFATMGAGPSARDAFAMAGVSPTDVDLAELYDAFTINPLVLLEETGLVPRGQSARWVLDGRTSPDGTLPVNTYGGLLSFGHTGTASGISMVVEAARQVMGTAGERQVPTELAFVHTYGAIMADHVSLVLGAPS